MPNNAMPQFNAGIRFAASWGDAAYHQETLENLKLAIKATKKLCAVSHSLDCTILTVFLN